MDNTDRKLLNLLQNRFPLVVEPFKALGLDLGIHEGELIERTTRLKERGIIRQINAIFDSRALGYQSTLVAMKVDPKRIDEAGEVISHHPGVSHNYQRDHVFNLWFTLTLPPSEDLEATVRSLEGKARAKRTLLLPALRTFKIGVSFDMTGEKDPFPSGEAKDPMANEPVAISLSQIEVDLVRELQEDIPLEGRPFSGMAKRLGITEEELLKKARVFQERGLMRRFAAVLRHQKAGFSFNAMGVWRVPEGRVEEVGKVMASFSGVSHCYQRPTYPDWPYNLFTMVHGRTKEDCIGILRAISEKIEISDYTPIFSIKEYKKVRVRYFV